MEDQLLLGGDELEEGQLQRSIWNKREGRKRTAGSAGVILLPWRGNSCKIRRIKANDASHKVLMHAGKSSRTHSPRPAVYMSLLLPC